MNPRQSIMKLLYPLIMRFSPASKKIYNKEKQTPAQPFHHLEVTLNNGEAFSFGSLKGKKVLLVNTASNCGYTAQYSTLQQLYQQYSDRLVIIGFPSNEFKEQEKGDDAAIAQFCQLNFGVTFPLAKKSTVLRGAGQHPVYKWLTNPEANGWNAQLPSWNFSKYLVDEEGKLLAYFDPGVDPLSPEIKEAIAS